MEIKQIGDKIALKGTVVTKSGYDKVEKVVGAFGGGILNLINFDPKELSKYYEDAIVRDIGIEGIKARVVKDTVILEGVVYSGIDATNAAVRAKVRMPKLLAGVNSILREDESHYRKETNRNQGTTPFLLASL